MDTNILEYFKQTPSENYFIFIPILIVVILWIIEGKFPVYLIIVIACFALYNLKRETDITLTSLKDAQKLLSEDVNQKFDDLTEKIQLLYEEMQQKQTSGGASSELTNSSQASNRSSSSNSEIVQNFKNLFNETMEENDYPI
ncbi:12421_t:CDS:2 [Entrophospora sp. SA101]|nr:12421_t:CDS:2 [Entrophospora sp. SA101]